VALQRALTALSSGQPAGCGGAKGTVHGPGVHGIIENLLSGVQL